jgi:hypothetical protein
MVTPANMPQQRIVPKAQRSADERYWTMLRKIVQHGGKLSAIRPRDLGR